MQGFRMRPPLAPTRLAGNVLVRCLRGGSRSRAPDILSDPGEDEEPERPSHSYMHPFIRFYLVQEVFLLPLVCALAELASDETFCLAFLSFPFPIRAP